MRVGGSERQSVARITGHGRAGPGKTGGGRFDAKTVEALMFERFDRRFLLYYRSFEKWHGQKHQVFD